MGSNFTHLIKSLKIISFTMFSSQYLLETQQYPLDHVTQNDTGMYVISASSEVGDISGQTEISIMSTLKFTYSYLIPDGSRPPLIKPGSRNLHS